MFSECMKRGALAHPMSARMEQRPRVWYSQPPPVSGCYPLSTRRLQCRSLSGWSCLSLAELSIYLRLPWPHYWIQMLTLCLPTIWFSALEVQHQPYSGPLLPVMVYAMEDPLAASPVSAPHMTKGSLRRSAHRGFQGYPMYATGWP